MTEMTWLPLLAWLSPSFPAGGFAYSHGLEWAAECGDIHDLASCAAWISEIIRFGSGRNDAALLTQAHRAISESDDATLRQTAELALALQPGVERRMETAALGNAFAATIRTAWPTPALERLRRVWSGDLAYPVAVGVVAAGRGVALDATLHAYLLAFGSSLVSAAIRLGVVGQTDGQRVIAALPPLIQTVASAAEGGLDALGGCAFRSDIASMRHETQYTRLFRS